MSPRTLVVVALALVFGGSAAVGVNGLVNTPGPRGAVVSVVVAAVDIPRGGMLTAEQLKTRDFPKDDAPLGAINKVEEAIERTVFIPLMKDDPVLSKKLAPKGSGRGMAALIPKGMRAFTIHTPNVASGVAGFVLPGNKVDVLLTVGDLGLNNQPPSALPISVNSITRVRQTGGGSTTTMLQNLEILAVDQKIEAPVENRMDSKELRSVTLLVTPQQANLLDLGQSKGTLHLALRNIEDSHDARTKPATVFDLQLQQELPWDERAKSVLEALGKALAQRQVVVRPPPAPAPPKAAEPPPTALIRTVRGVREGGVIVPLPEASSRMTDLQQRSPRG
jgi:pilus assembly protein CpaB